MPAPQRLDLSHDGLHLAFSLHDGLRLERWNSPSTGSWIDPSSPLFAVWTAGRLRDASSPGATVRDMQVERSTADATRVDVVIAYADTQLEVDLHFVVYPETALLEQWVMVRNAGVEPVRIERIDSFALHLPRAGYKMLSFTSSWGAEFNGACQTLDEALVLESRSGRSSHDMHPFCVLSRGNELFSAAIAWSGNWVIRFEPDQTGIAVSGGLSDWQHFTDIAPGAEVEAPHAIIALGTGDLDHIAQQYHRVGRRYWYPQRETSSFPPLEWNHWWSYEDRGIDEGTFRANVEAAAGLGLDLCTLDVGWFGSSNRDAAWSDHRGDWDRVNHARFPSGIRSLSDHAHEHGLLFGLWCEIEGLGTRSDLRTSHPEFAAMRDGVPLGYVCFGCKEVREWALQTLERLVVDFRCDWIKLDFNVDPGAGCDRSDHGHGAGDGLYAHYSGYYMTLSRFRARHPDITLESCSSGGLRIDLGIMQQTHVTFLSDPDWPEHNLQVFWGATMMLAPEVCLHWGPSQWIVPHPHQTFDPHSPTLTRQQLDYRIRTALLGAAGVSLRLPELPTWVVDSIAFHVRLYKRYIRRFVREGILYRLTKQPRRDGGGDRWCAFQYSLPRQHLVFVFRLPAAEPSRVVRLRNLDAAALFRVTIVDDGSELWRRGGDLMREGIEVNWLNEQDSTILVFEEERAGS